MNQFLTGCEPVQKISPKTQKKLGAATNPWSGARNMIHRRHTPAGWTPWGRFSFENIRTQISETLDVRHCTAFAAHRLTAIMPFASAQEKAKVALIANLSPKQTRAKVTELALVEWEACQRGHGYYRTAKS